MFLLHVHHNRQYVLLTMQVEIQDKTCDVKSKPRYKIRFYEMIWPHVGLINKQPKVMRRKTIDLFPDKQKGLFQTHTKVGLLFPLMSNKMFGGGKIMYIQIPVFNDVRGEIRAIDLMKDPDFVKWAIDPWSGKINVSFDS
jgi:hypothetical protein